MRKGFLDYFHEIDADIFCLQEIKLQEGQIDLALDGYYQYWNYATRKGYSGTAVFTKKKPLSVRYGVGEESTEPEGRILTLEYDDFFLINVYTPNSKRDLARLSYRLQWEDNLFEYLLELDAKKPIIYCGDLNVAHLDIDVRNASSNHGNSGFTTEERGKMTRLLAAGFVDTLRHFHPEDNDIFTWWSYMKTVRERNIGWRIDYFILSERITQALKDAQAQMHVLGSDHCPILLEIDDSEMNQKTI